MYIPRINEVNSCPPGTPWNARPLYSPSLCISTTGAFTSSCTSSTEILSVSLPSSVIYERSSFDTSSSFTYTLSKISFSILPNTVFNCASISDENNPSSLTSSLGKLPFPAPDCLIGTTGLIPVFLCITEIYFSSSVAAIPASPTVVTTCLRGFIQTSPAAYNPSIAVFFEASVITYPLSSSIPKSFTKEVAGSYPANTNTPKPSLSSNTSSLPVSLFL